MQVTVKTYARFAEIIGKEQTFAMDSGSIILDAIRQAVQEKPEAFPLIFTPEGELQPYVVVLRNKKRLTHEGVKGTVLEDGDEILMYPPVSGG